MAHAGNSATASSKVMCAWRPVNSCTSCRRISSIAFGPGSGEAVCRECRLLSRAPVPGLIGDLIASVVAGADQWPRFNVLKAQPQGLFLHLRELRWVVVTLEWQMLLRRTQVLANGQDVAIDGTEVHERLAELRPRLPQADHQA